MIISVKLGFSTNDIDIIRAKYNYINIIYFSTSSLNDYEEIKLKFAFHINDAYLAAAESDFSSASLCLCANANSGIAYPGKVAEAF